MQASNFPITSVFLLSLVEGFERFSYYGFRSMIVLYAVNEAGFGWDHNTAFSYYAYFTILIGVLSFPMGLLSDFTFKQYNGALIGGGIAFLGYLLMLPEVQALSFGGIALILLGTALFKPNLTVLFGRLFHKADRSRNTGFIFFYTALNIGAFASAIAVAFISERFGYVWGFALVSLAMILSQVLLFISKDFLQLLEVKGQAGFRPLSNDPYPQILDRPPPLPSQVINNSRIAEKLILIGLITLVVTMFWQVYDLAMPNLYQAISASGQQLFGFDLQQVLFSGNSVFTLVFGVLIFVIWWLRQAGNTLLWLGLAFICACGAVLAVWATSLLGDQLLIPLVFLITALWAFAEIIIGALTLSYVTRLSPTRFSSTIIGFFFMAIFLGARLVDLVRGISFFESPGLLIVFGGLMALIGVLFLALRKPLEDLSGGIK